MKCISLFAGIGGFDLALTKLGHEIVYANEWDKYAAQTYEKNFKHKVDTRDITTVGIEDFPDHDFLVGGFPCQAFSLAGKRLGFSDIRGNLFWEICRLLQTKHPKILLLENVKGLLSHDNGNTFKTIIGSLDELGYDLQWQVLNSKNFGVPQNRERVFIIGHLRGTSRPQVFPITNSNESNNDSDKKLPEQISNTLRTNYSSGYSNETYVGTLRTHKDGQGFREVKSGLSPTIPARAREDGNGRRFKENGEPAFTLTGQDIHGVYDGMSIRRLTPTECERLQGFPEGWTEGVSDTQRYKQLGNAVTVNVVEEIIKRLSFN